MARQVSASAPNGWGFADGNNVDRDEVYERVDALSEMALSIASWGQTGDSIVDTELARATAVLWDAANYLLDWIGD